MHPELEKILGDVIKGIPGAYLNFKKKILELKVTFNHYNFVEYMSQQTLTQCDPEALLDLGFIITNNTYIFYIPPQLKIISTEAPPTLNLKNLYVQLKTAAQTNLGAQGAILQLLNSANNSGLFSDVILDIENEFQTVFRQFEEKKNCPLDQKKFLHFNEAIILASELSDNKDVVAALTQFETSAKLGLALAHNECGLQYESSDAVEQDLFQAVYHYENAEKQLHAYGSFNLGWMLATGSGANENKSRATKCYQKSAYLGCAEAQYHSAKRCEKGIGLPLINIEQALFWLDQAINQNYSDAIFHKGWLYEKAVGVPRNLPLAAKHYLLAAKQSDFKIIAKGALRFLMEHPDFKPDDVVETEITNLLNMSSNGQPNNENATNRIEFAKWLMEIEYTTDAIEIYGKIIAKFPTYTKAYLARAKAYTIGNRNKMLALTDLEKVIELDPQSESALKGLIEICDRLNENKKVIYYCNKLFEIDTEQYSKYYLFRGIAYAELNQHHDAIRDYSAYIKVYPDDVKAYNARARSYIKLKWRKAAQEDKIRALRITSGKTSRPQKFNPTAIDHQAKSLSDNNEEIPKNLHLLIQSLYIIGRNPQIKNCIVLQLIPINEIAVLLMKHTQSNNTKRQFHIHDLVKLQEIVLQSTQTLLKKSYDIVIIHNSHIEITLTDKGHKVIKSKPEKDLLTLKDTILEALPEYQIYQNTITLKHKSLRLIKNISQFEKNLAVTLQNVQDTYAKKMLLLESISTYNGNSDELKQISQQIQNIINKIKQFINDSTDILSTLTSTELDKKFQSFVSQSDSEFIKSVQPLLQQLEIKHKTFTKLLNFNHKGLFRSLNQLIGQFHSARSEESKKTEMLNQKEVTLTNQCTKSSADDKSSNASIKLPDSIPQPTTKKPKHKKKHKKVTQANNESGALFDNQLVLFRPTVVAKPHTQELPTASSLVNYDISGEDDDPFKAAKEFLEEGKNNEVVVRQLRSNIQPIGKPCKI